MGRLPLDGGMVRLPRRIPYTQAMGLLLTGRKAPAAEMHRMGLVNEVVPADELDAAVDRWVDDDPGLRAARRCGPSSRWCSAPTHLTAREAHAVRLPALVAALDSPDAGRRACAPSRRSARRTGADR